MTEKRSDRDYRLTVGDLIAELSEFDANMLVCVQGYESGCGPPRHPVPAKARLDVNDIDEWYFGPHDDDPDPTATDIVDIVWIGRS